MRTIKIRISDEHAQILLELVNKSANFGGSFEVRERALLELKVSEWLENLRYVPMGELIKKAARRSSRESKK